MQAVNHRQVVLQLCVCALLSSSVCSRSLPSSSPKPHPCRRLRYPPLARPGAPTRPCPLTAPPPVRLFRRLTWVPGCLFLGRQVSSLCLDQYKDVRPYFNQPVCDDLSTADLHRAPGPSFCSPRTRQRTCAQVCLPYLTTRKTATAARATTCRERLWIASRGCCTVARPVPTR